MNEFVLPIRVDIHDVDFNGVYTAVGGQTLGSVQTNNANSHVAIFSQEGDYKILTDGDCFDENPSFDSNGNILYNSYGVGRDATNNFVKYFPSEIYKLNTATMDIQTILSNDKYSFVKPVEDRLGNLYFIKRPENEKTDGNPLLDILLIPVRIIQGIVGFISSFVMCFSGKPLVNGKSMQAMGDGGIAKNKNGAPVKTFINQNLVNVEKELKKNKHTQDYGFIPHSWKLVKLSDGQMQELANGVADFCVIEENGEVCLLYTNGKHIFSIKNGQRTKILDTDFCLRIGGIQQKVRYDNLFDSL